MKMGFIRVNAVTGGIVLSTRDIVVVQEVYGGAGKPKGFIVTTDGRKIEFYDNYEAVSTAVINSP